MAPDGRVLSRRFFRGGKPAGEPIASRQFTPVPFRPAVPGRRRVGLALGGGSALGWAHIGIIRELMAQGVEIDVVAGTSIGAVVGACHAAGRLDALEAKVNALQAALR